VLLIGTYGALAGCSATSAKPAPLPSEITSSSPSPSVSASVAAAPTLPAEARGTGAKAAKAFVRYYVSLINHAASTGDTVAARRYTASKCRSCEAILAKVDDVYANGGQILGSGWSIRNMSYKPLQPAQRPILSVGILVSRQVMTERRGAEAKTFPGGHNQLTIQLDRANGDWRVAALERL
jgi:hypothetical protein